MLCPTIFLPGFPLINPTKVEIREAPLLIGFKNGDNVSPINLVTPTWNLLTVSRSPSVSISNTAYSI